jgi:hypothetical protein
VGGVRRVAHEHDVALMPALVGDAPEVQPGRVADATQLVDQRVAVQVPGEDLFQQRHAVVGSEPVEAERLPDFRCALDDEGAGVVGVGVGVKPDPAGRGLLEAER